jgi:acyl dehydratase
MRTITGLEELKAAGGETLGTSDWHEITQKDVDTFADVTGDHQWIHVDVERAKETPFGGTIAHGYLTLSLGPSRSTTASTRSASRRRCRSRRRSACPRRSRR